MTESKFTPGPWRVFRADAPSGVLIGIGEVTGEGITDCGFGVWRDGDEALANARLIAAAPALYEALQYITRWLMTDVDALPPHVTRDDVRIYHLDGAVLHNCLERARAALTQANGPPQTNQDRETK